MVIDNERMYIDIPKTILGSAALTAVGGLIKGLPYLPAAAVLWSRRLMRRSERSRTSLFS